MRHPIAFFYFAVTGMVLLGLVDLRISLGVAFCMVAQNISAVRR
jgi:hypothetical protein